MFIFSANIIQNSIGNVNFSNPTWDIFIFLFFITIAFFYGVFVGRDKIIHLLLSSFFSFFIVKFDPFLKFAKNLKPEDLSPINIIIFAGCLILFYILLTKRSILSNIETYTPSFVHILIFSFLHAGLLIALALNLLDSKTISIFGSTIQNIFINPIAFFAWIFCSILALILLKGNEED